MNLKSFASNLVKTAQAGMTSTGPSMAAKMSNYKSKTPSVKDMTKKQAKAPGSIMRKINTTTPYGMV